MEEKKKADEPQFSTKIKQLVADYEATAAPDMKKENENHELDALFFLNRKRTTKKPVSKANAKRKAKKKKQNQRDKETSDDHEDAYDDDDDEESPGESGSSDDQAKPKRRARKETHLFDLSLKGVMFNNYYYCWM